MVRSVAFEIPSKKYYSITIGEKEDNDHTYYITTMYYYIYYYYVLLLYYYYILYKYYVFILGDFNADIQNTSIFGACIFILDFCDNNTLCFLDKEFLPPDSFTYVSQAHGTTS